MKVYLILTPPAVMIKPRRWYRMVKNSDEAEASPARTRHGGCGWCEAIRQVAVVLHYCSFEIEKANRVNLIAWHQGGPLKDAAETWH